MTVSNVTSPHLFAISTMGSIQILHGIPKLVPGIAIMTSKVESRCSRITHNFQLEELVYILTNYSDLFFHTTYQLELPPGIKNVNYENIRTNIDIYSYSLSFFLCYFLRNPFIHCLSVSVHLHFFSFYILYIHVRLSVCICKDMLPFQKKESRKLSFFLKKRL